MQPKNVFESMNSEGDDLLIISTGRHLVKKTIQEMQKLS